MHGPADPFEFPPLHCPDCGYRTDDTAAMAMHRESQHGPLPGAWDARPKPGRDPVDPYDWLRYGMPPPVTGRWWEPVLVGIAVLLATAGLIACGAAAL